VYELVLKTVILISVDKKRSRRSATVKEDELQTLFNELK